VRERRLRTFWSLLVRETRGLDDVVAVQFYRDTPSSLPSRRNENPHKAGTDASVAQPGTCYQGVIDPARSLGRSLGTTREPVRPSPGLGWSSPTTRPQRLDRGLERAQHESVTEDA
jgi:hypothetical protein